MLWILYVGNNFWSVKFCETHKYKWTVNLFTKIIVLFTDWNLIGYEYFIIHWRFYKTKKLKVNIFSKQFFIINYLILFKNICTNIPLLVRNLLSLSAAIWEILRFISALLRALLLGYETIFDVQIQTIYKCFDNKLTQYMISFRRQKNDFFQ